MGIVQMIKVENLTDPIEELLNSKIGRNQTLYLHNITPNINAYIYRNFGRQHLHPQPLVEIPLFDFMLGFMFGYRIVSVSAVINSAAKLKRTSYSHSFSTNSLPAQYISAILCKRHSPVSASISLRTMFRAIYQSVCPHCPLSSCFSIMAPYPITPFL